MRRRQRGIQGKRLAHRFTGGGKRLSRAVEERASENVATGQRRIGFGVVRILLDGAFGIIDRGVERFRIELAEMIVGFAKEQVCLDILRLVLREPHVLLFSEAELKVHGHVSRDLIL